MERARKAAVSMRQAILVSNDVAVPSSCFEGRRFVHKELQMYYERMRLAFSAGSGGSELGFFIL